MSQQPPEKPARNLDEWDAEIEAEFRRVVRATKTASAPNASRRKGWQRNYTLVPREWELRLLGAKRISTYRLAIELLVPALVRQREAGHRLQQGGAGGKNLCSIEMGSPRRIGTAGPDRGGSQAAQVAARRSAPHPDKTNMSAIAHSHMRASAPEIHDNMRAIAPKGSLFSFLVLLIEFLESIGGVGG